MQQDLKPNSDAVIAWDAVSAASAEQRYTLFQLAAETVLKRSWHCEPMQRLAIQTGQF
jgi:hypothetical protein